MSNIKFEDRKLCKKCGGVCCKATGCFYFVSDIKPFNKENVRKLLDTGNVSIVAALKFDILNGKTLCSPFLYLRARNTERGVIDLLSLKRQCSMLREDGCSYDFEHRPGSAINFIPHKNCLTGKFDCYPLVDPLDKVYEYVPYQNLLGRMVKYYSGMSVREKLCSDVENFIYQILIKDFDGISSDEVENATECFDDLIKAFPDEANRAVSRYKSDIKAGKIKKRVNK